MIERNSIRDFPLRERLEAFTEAVVRCVAGKRRVDAATLRELHALREDHEVCEQWTFQVRDEDGFFVVQANGYRPSDAFELQRRVDKRWQDDGFAQSAMWARCAGRVNEGSTGEYPRPVPRKASVTRVLRVRSYPAPEGEPIRLTRERLEAWAEEQAEAEKGLRREELARGDE